MSRNFYALGHQDDDDPMYHVGKLSGGVFTWAMDQIGRASCRERV